MAIAVALILTGCGSRGRPAMPTTPTSSSSVRSSSPAATAPASPAEAARRDALAAYLGMWKAYAQASHTSDWQAPNLSQYASGDALQFVTRNLYADHYNGLISKGEPVNKPRVTSAGQENPPKSVMVVDCADDRNWLQYRTDGSLLDSTPGALHRVVAEVRLHTDGKWRVTQFGIDSAGSCQ
ncbi:Secreted protein/lipoprotein [Frankia sp. AiPs1]|uniref:hypothetical protein n=1 Tax=Frankia sp. AiPa1 TaxID=573492 RepID=UPI00202AC715|nr:hypothetical protein [Frankia sp. AiPa1]MCL9759301.1 hypothetical protein [Frankia sp. AiPa1]